jgi:hypothetical protein
LLAFSARCVGWGLTSVFIEPAQLGSFSPMRNSSPRETGW